MTASRGIRKPAEPLPPGIRESERNQFCALRGWNKKMGKPPLTVEEFRNRRRYNHRMPEDDALIRYRDPNEPQTAEGARDVLRRRGLLPRGDKL